MTSESKELTKDNAGNYGPAMRQLNDRQRAFVIALLTQGNSNHTRAAAAAGYNGTDKTLRVAGHRLAHDPKILAAMQEEARGRIQSSVILAASVLEEIAGDPLHKDRLKAASMLLNRGGLHETSEVRHVHELSSKEMDARIAQLAKEIGIDDPMKLIGDRSGGKTKPEEPIIDAEFTEPTADGLEDLL